MQYTLILTETAEGGIQVTVPALPACRVEATTRDDAIRLGREAIAQIVSRGEVVQVEIPAQPRATVARKCDMGRITPESFLGKLFLLVADKLLFGIVALVAGLYIQKSFDNAQKEQLAKQEVSRIEAGFLKDVTPTVNGLTTKYLSELDRFYHDKDARPQTATRAEDITQEIIFWFKYSESLISGMRSECSKLSDPAKKGPVSLSKSDFIEKLKLSNKNLREWSSTNATDLQKNIRELKDTILSSYPTSIHTIRSLMVESITLCK